MPLEIASHPQCAVPTTVLALQVTTSNTRSKRNQTDWSTNVKKELETSDKSHVKSERIYNAIVKIPQIYS
eukprot:5801810-Amphidinium_carterae.1